MLDRVKADRATRDGLSDAGQHVLGAEYLQQPQHLDELAFAAFGHARFDQAPQRGKFLGQVPADQRRCLVESADLLFEQRQVMQRVEDEVLALVGARMTGDHLGPAGDHHLLDIAADQEMARRVAVIAVPRAVDLFGLKCPDEKLGLGIVVGLPTRLMLAAIPWASSRLVYSAQAYCTPRSEWWTRLPQGGRRAVSARVSAATARPAPR